MKLNKLLFFTLFALLITVSIISYKLQTKRYDLLENDYRKLESTYNKTQEKTFSTVNPEIKKLKNQLNAEKKKTTSLRKKLKETQTKNEENEATTTTSSTSNYLKIKYWFDDKNYQLSDEEQKLYQDPFLSKKVSNKRIFVSSTVSEERLENGQTVYSAMTSKGLVYSSSYINLNQLDYTDYSASSEAISSEENEKYKKIRFYKTSEERRLGEESEQKWYSDYTLSQEIKDSKYLRIVSEVDDFEASNKVHLYCALTKDGDIVYMHESPELVPIEE